MSIPWIPFVELYFTKLKRALLGVHGVAQGPVVMDLLDQKNSSLYRYVSDAAFAELYDRRARLIRAICFDATRDMQIASELTQDVFVRAFQKLGDLSDPQRFAPWLVGIARHACQEWRRGRVNERRRRRELSDDATDRPPGDDLDDQVAALR